MVWIIIAVAVVGILILAFYRVAKRPTRSSGPSCQEDTYSDGIRSSAPAREVASRQSAAQVLSRVQSLRHANAQWDAIFSQLNPAADPEVQRLLIEIRGPHLFAPNLGLGVIEDGCLRVLASSPGGDVLAALREAIRRQDPFVR